jgi:hypothetical protein
MVIESTREQYKKRFKIRGLYNIYEVIYTLITNAESGTRGLRGAQLAGN